jgi:hypothetical protein
MCGYMFQPLRGHIQAVQARESQNYKCKRNFKCRPEDDHGMAEICRRTFV